MKLARTMVWGCLSILLSVSVTQAQWVDITRPGDPIKLISGTNDADTNAGAPPAGEVESHVIDDVGQKYLNFVDFNSGFAVTPSANAGNQPVVGLRLYSANDAVERDPASYELSGSNAGLDGPWTVISSGDLALPADRTPGGATAVINPDGTRSANAYFQEVLFNNTSSYSHFQLTFPTLKDAAAANSMQIAEVEFLAVPEPTSLGLAISGLLGLGLLGRKRS